MLAALVLAVEGRPVWATGLMVAAIVDKPGLGEAIPVLAVAVPARWARPALIAALVLVTTYALYNLTSLSTLLPVHELTNGSEAAGPPQPGELLYALGANSWAVLHEHVLVTPLCTGVAALWWWLRGRRLQDDPGLLAEVLWLLALILLLRTALDPWDVTYYNLPLVVVLLWLEAGSGRPWMTLTSTVGVLLLVPTNRLLPIGPDVQAVLYAAVIIPVLALLARRAMPGSAPNQPDLRRPWVPTLGAVSPAGGSGSPPG